MSARSSFSPPVTRGEAAGAPVQAGPATQDVAIRLLTGGDIRIASSLDIGWKGAQTRILFALLAIRTGEPAPRDWLAGVMWPEHPQASARRNLRMALLNLRRALGAAAEAMLHATPESITLSTDPDSVDIALFASLADRGDPESAVAALKLYRGDVLQAIPDPPEPIRRLRGSLRDRAVTLGVTLLSDPGSADEKTRLWAARRLIEIEPANEPAHRELMRAAADRGDLSGALRQFQNAETALRDRLDLPPSDETVRLRDAIMRNGATARPGPVRTSAAPSSSLPSESPPRAAVRRRAPFGLAGSLMLLAATGAGLFGGLVAPEPVDRTIALRPVQIAAQDCAVSGVSNEVQQWMRDVVLAQPGFSLGVLSSGAPAAKSPSVAVEASIFCVGDVLRATAEIRRDRDVIWLRRYDSTAPQLGEFSNQLTRDLIEAFQIVSRDFDARKIARR